MFNKQDENTDYKNNWIEEQLYNVISYLDAGYTDDKIAEELLLIGVPEDMLSLIIVGGAMLHVDEVTDYRGEDYV